VVALTVRGLTPRKKREYAAAYLMIAPMVLGIAVFFIIPTIWSIMLSFTEGPDYVTYQWVGLKNYATLLSPGSDMWQELLNTFYYAFASVALSAWQQSLKSGRTNTLKQWLRQNFVGDEDGRMTGRYWEEQHPGRTVQNWVDVVGPDHVFVVLIDDEDHDRADHRGERGEQGPDVEGDHGPLASTVGPLDGVTSRTGADRGTSTAVSGSVTPSSGFGRTPRPMTSATSASTTTSSAPWASSRPRRRGAEPGTGPVQFSWPAQTRRRTRSE
jgi:hypothetical protein